ncbi:hypothetical protein [Streptomyces griseus]|uniref:hypothetical protein n=1 Tax=Streptomyces griseus TaxID=1911 RepID=UPI0033AFADF9
MRGVVGLVDGCARHPALLTLITCADWDTTTRTYTANLVITAQPATGPGQS